MTERWEDIPGWEGLYQASDLGRVKSCARVIVRGDGIRQPVRERILRQCTGGSKKQIAAGKAYRAVRLYRDGKASPRLVHQLVLLAFAGESPSHEGCHRDGNPTNNRLSNLRWGTRSSNLLDSVAHGTHHWASKTSCPQGHPYDEGNTYTYPDGRRDCKTCRAVSNEKYRARKALAA